MNRVSPTFSGDFYRLMTFSLLAIAGIGLPNHSDAQEKTPRQEFYELRIYKIQSNKKQNALLDYLENAYLPAIKRTGVNRIGVFTAMKRKGPAKANSPAPSQDVILLIPFQSFEQFSELRTKLNADPAYQAAAKKHFDRPLKDPVFQRIESRFLKAFEGMPVIEQPEYSKKKTERMFEIRLYESHTEDHARRKVAMFNDGEIDLMKDLDMAPVFFGETLIGPRVPNLIYMLSAKNSEEHQKHWRAFIDSPVWAKMSKLEIYKDTVSKIQNWYLVPTRFSDL